MVSKILGICTQYGVHVDGVSCNPALEEAIFEAPLDLGARSVYGDWIATTGDPRGPWFALSAAVEANPLDVRLRSAATELFNANREAFLGEGAALLPGAWFGFLGGFLDEVRLQPFEALDNAGEAATALFEHPGFRFVRHLALGDLPELQDIVWELAGAAPRLLESVTMIDTDARGTSIDIDPIASLPTLRRLGAHRVRWTVPMPALRELHLYYDDRSEHLPATVPNLEELALDCRELTPTLTGISKLVAGLPALRRLRFLNLQNADELVISFTPPARLELVDVSHSPLSSGAVGRVASWPPKTALMAIRTRVEPSAVERLVAEGRSVVASTPESLWWEDLRSDAGGDTWIQHRARVEGRDALRCVPDAGRQLLESTMRNTTAEHYDLNLIEMAISLPSKRWHTWPWACAAHARSWKSQFALSEATAREGLMREPQEPNFYAFVIYALRRQGLPTEAAAEVPRAEKALAHPPRTPQETGGPLCMLECMICLARVGRHADAIALKERHTLDDPNIQAMLAMCHAAVGEHALARAALVRAGIVADAPDYVLEKHRRNIYEHANAVIALLPPDPSPDDAIAALTRGSYYHERDWFKEDPNLAALRSDPRFIALVSQW